MIKPSKVVFIDERLEKYFNSLKCDDPVKLSLIKAIHVLREDAFSGTQIPKRLIPKDYIRKYSINNLWKHDLIGGWRLLYTITSDYDIEIIYAILDWFNQKNYEKKMNY